MKLVILDRDGVINFDSAQFIKTPAEWKPIPGSLEAIARLFDMAMLNAIHEKMHKALFAAGGRVGAIFYCPHTADSNCDCRKPKPGMFKRISATLNVDLKGVPAIGDSLRDLQSCAQLGCLPILVHTGKGEKTAQAGGLPDGTLQFADLAAAVDHILGVKKK